MKQYVCVCSCHADLDSRNYISSNSHDAHFGFRNVQTDKWPHDQSFDPMFCDNIKIYIYFDII